MNWLSMFKNPYRPTYIFKNLYGAERMFKKILQTDTYVQKSLWISTYVQKSLQTDTYIQTFIRTGTYVQKSPQTYTHVRKSLRTSTYVQKYLRTSTYVRKSNLSASRPTLKTPMVSTDPQVVYVQNILRTGKYVCSKISVDTQLCQKHFRTHAKIQKYQPMNTNSQTSLRTGKHDHKLLQTGMQGQSLLWIVTVWSSQPNLPFKLL